MAWQTPKIDWTAADGVRDLDFNRIEGNILELYKTGSVKSDTTVYVSPTGSDDTGDGLSDKPFKTITKALNSLPRSLNGKVVTINLAAGTYPEHVVIRGFDGPIILTGTSGASVVVSSFSVVGCCCLLENITLTVNADGIVIKSGAMLLGTGALHVTGAPVSLTVAGASVVSIRALTSLDASRFAVSVEGSSRFYADTLTGSGNASGILCNGGSLASFMSNGFGVFGAMFVTYAGGRIHAGAQAELPCY